MIAFAKGLQPFGNFFAFPQVQASLTCVLRSIFPWRKRFYARAA